ncbi:MAG: archaeal heat shock protein Hsp20 [Candidatus Micrarchaeia archaeon]
MVIKKRKVFDDDFDDFERRIREDMERFLEGIFSREFSELSDEKPIVYGFSMRIDSEGKPTVHEFGNFNPRFKTISEEREPLVDVIEDKDMVTVIAEVPGVSKEDINLRATEDTLSIKVDTAERKYSKTVSLPCRIKPASAKATYKNGVLEVKLERQEPKESSSEGERIEIE